MAAYTITAAAPKAHGACILIGAPPTEFTFVLFEVTEFLKLVRTKVLDAGVLEACAQCAQCAGDLDLVVSAAILEKLPIAPAVIIVTAVFARKIITSAGSGKLVIPTLVRNTEKTITQL
ncbi:uncharacterized protein RAG0_02687 [Rhynchosporium agropyri]|uniref:Uncharacterized protein n=1 Tax=Rhynchosporium agropyri TaxID=914238 RepID=A0A1E1K254_9HELO|nr:uncharacterized protein RAG0_02687 [Rhynchosporium agropyri]